MSDTEKKSPQDWLTENYPCNSAYGLAYQLVPIDAEWSKSYTASISRTRAPYLYDVIDDEAHSVIKRMSSDERLEICRKEAEREPLTLEEFDVHQAIVAQACLRLCWFHHERDEPEQAMEKLNSAAQIWFTRKAVAAERFDEKQGKVLPANLQLGTPARQDESNRLMQKVISEAAGLQAKNPRWSLRAIADDIHARGVVDRTHRTIYDYVLKELKSGSESS